MNIVFNILKAFIYCVVFAALFLFFTKIGLPAFIGIAILLGLIAAIANSKRSLPDVWESDTVYAVILIHSKDGENADSADHQFCFAKTWSDAQSLLRKEADKHIMQLHKPVACDNSMGYMRFRDDNGNVWTLKIKKQCILRSEFNEMN